MMPTQLIQTDHLNVMPNLSHTHEQTLAIKRALYTYNVGSHVLQLLSVKLVSLETEDLVKAGDETVSA